VIRCAKIRLNRGKFVILDADRPIGRRVFTHGTQRWRRRHAPERRLDGWWTPVGGDVEPTGSARGRRGRDVESTPTDPSGARNARPDHHSTDALDRIAGMASHDLP
jgi:hypothetical protein